MYGILAYGLRTKKDRKMEWSDEKEKAAEKLLARLMNEPLAAERQEFGKMLMTHIEDFTPKERERYDELKAILSKGQ